MASGIAASVAAYCSATPWLGAVLHSLGVGGVAPALLILGLIGGFSHCVGMCGPFVLAQVAAEGTCSTRDAPSELRRLRGALLLPYHLGRATTYVALGAMAGGVVGVAAAVARAPWLPGLLLGAAAAVFLVQGLSGLFRGLRRIAPRIAPLPLSSLVAGPLARWAGPLLLNPLGWRGYALGVALGFLPCGLLWGALAAAAGTGGALAGAEAMAAFALGTGPGLFAVGYVGVFFRRRAPGALKAVAVPVMLLNATFLGVLALRAFGGG